MILIGKKKKTNLDKAKNKIYHPQYALTPGTNSGLPLINEAKTKTIIAGDFNAHLPELGYER